MDVRKLVKMANDIGAFFGADPDKTVAVDGIANHLQKFWEPRMRREIIAHVEATGGGELAPLVVEAVRKLR